MSEYSNILKALREASVFDIFLISFLLLPFVFAAWMEIFEALGYNTPKREAALYVVAALYVFFLFLMIFGSKRRQKREVAKERILAYLERLEAKGLSMVSYEGLRDHVSAGYSDAFLDSVIAAYPRELRGAKLKGGRPGIARLREESGAYATG